MNSRFDDIATALMTLTCGIASMSMFLVVFAGAA
jgi:hypothetical protein